MFTLVKIHQEDVIQSEYFLLYVQIFWFLFFQESWNFFSRDYSSVMPNKQ